MHFFMYSRTLYCDYRIVFSLEGLSVRVRRALALLCNGVEFPGMPNDDPPICHGMFCLPVDTGFAFGMWRSSDRFDSGSRRIVENPMAVFVPDQAVGSIYWANYLLSDPQRFVGLFCEQLLDTTEPVTFPAHLEKLLDQDLKLCNQSLLDVFEVGQCDALPFADIHTFVDCAEATRAISGTDWRAEDRPWFVTQGVSLRMAKEQQRNSTELVRAAKSSTNGTIEASRVAPASSTRSYLDLLIEHHPFVRIASFVRHVLERGSKP